MPRTPHPHGNSSWRAIVTDGGQIGWLTEIAKTVLCVIGSRCAQSGGISTRCGADTESTESMQDHFPSCGWWKFGFPGRLALPDAVRWQGCE